ncbi:hypothetical protein [uncultured Phycicoccus sp.]|uniref:hypothetical protein n=1 Tax=uncultured Phycicoccus sp. TaxID=661422 RepID=UPI0026388CFA|nr:hypothetical protein [uncultured Phycicoccus sp.]
MRRTPRRGRDRPPGTVTRLGAAAAILVGLGLGGCSGPGSAAREDAVTAVRAKAEALRTDLQAAARGSTGDAQLEAVREALPDLPLTATTGGDGVVVQGAVTAGAEAGGGLSYEGFSARLCLRYRIAGGTGETEIEDAACPADVDTVAPADETVQLGD